VPQGQNFFGFRGPPPVHHQQNQPTTNQLPRPQPQGQVHPPTQHQPHLAIQPVQSATRVISQQAEITSPETSKHVGPSLPGGGDATKRKLIPVALRVKRKNVTPSTAPQKKKRQEEGAAVANTTEAAEDDAVDKFMEEMNALGALTT